MSIVNSLSVEKKGDRFIFSRVRAREPIIADDTDSQHLGDGLAGMSHHPALAGSVGPIWPPEFGQERSSIDAAAPATTPTLDN
jgi:hypothetical protein